MHVLVSLICEHIIDFLILLDGKQWKAGQTYWEKNTTNVNSTILYGLSINTQSAWRLYMLWFDV